MHSHSLTLESFWEKVIDGHTANNIEELFLMRLSAFRLLADPHRQEKAKQFLLQTMTIPEEEYNFPAKAAFVSEVEHWEFPSIKAQRSDDVHAVMYEIEITRNGEKQKLHELSFFKKEAHQFRYTHKFNLIEEQKKYDPNAAKELIRQIGDPILHRAPVEVEDFSEQDNPLFKQIEVLKNALFRTGGAGIAANQCKELENPPRVIIAGVDYSNPVHVGGVTYRYPKALFPQMKIYINPKILVLDTDEENFDEGCLSVQGLVRASVRRAKSVIIQYQDITGKIHTEKSFATSARVMLHELDHILNGMVYIQRIFQELEAAQVKQLIEIVTPLLSSSEEYKPISGNPPLEYVFKRDADNKLYFSEDEAKASFKKLRKETIVGIHLSLEQELAKKASLASGQGMFAMSVDGYEVGVPKDHNVSLHASVKFA